MWINRTKEKLAAGEAVYGPFLRIAGPVVVEQAAAGGFDFVIIDLEHSAIDPSDVQSMIYAAAAHGITPLVRVPEANAQTIHRVLDIGAHGVMVPQVSTEAEAHIVSGATRFGPVGTRGMAGPTRGNGWGEKPPAEAHPHFNAQVLTLAQIESQEALDNLDAIAAQPGIDVLFVGPVDLSQALGVPGQVDHPRLVAAIHAVIAAAKKGGKQMGIYVGNPEAARYWKEQGVKLIATGLDTVMLRQAFKQARSAMD